jgi:hypothetical protein
MQNTIASEQQLPVDPLANDFGEMVIWLVNW